MSKNYSDSLEGLKVVDLFCGIGAFHYAFKKYGAKIVYAVEWDEDASNVYEKNWGIKPAGDITLIQENDVPDHDILCAGFPCQPFSISGSLKGFEDSRGTLFFDVARIAKVKQPKLIILENVKNLVNHDDGKTFQVILKTLDEIGYNIRYEILDASDYGIPQSRKRVFIVCIRKDFDLALSDYTFPKPIPLKKHLKDLLLPDKEVVNCIINRPDIRIYAEDDIYDCKPVRIGTVNKGGQGERIYSTKGTAITLSASGGGAGAKTGLYLVNGNVRRLDPRECARLDGFPDTFKIAKNRNAAYKQFGNSIVVDTLIAVIKQICDNKEMMIWLKQ